MSEQDHVMLEETCAVCGWHGKVDAAREGRFVSWTCPKCETTRSRLLPPTPGGGSGKGSSKRPRNRR